MLKKILALLAMLYAAACFAAVDVNKATAAELDAVKGIGPAISQKIVDERKNGAYKDWDDFITRVKGVGDKSAAKLSEGGLTVNGSTYKGVAAKTDAKADSKSSKTEAKSQAKEEKATAKADAKDDKTSTKKSAKEEKAEAKKAAREEKAQAKAEAKAEKAKAEKAKDAASARK